MGLRDALNSRLSNQEAAVPITTETVMVVQEYTPPPPPPMPAPPRNNGVPDPVPGQLGYVSEEIPYDEDALAALLVRLGKGVDWMLDHLEEPGAEKQFGHFIDVCEKTAEMMRAHAVAKIMDAP